MSLQESVYLCDRLLGKLEEAAQVPEEHLSGEIREAVEEIRRYQTGILKDIRNNIINLEEMR